VRNTNSICIHTVNEVSRHFDVIPGRHSTKDEHYSNSEYLQLFDIVQALPHLESFPVVENVSKQLLRATNSSPLRQLHVRYMPTLTALSKLKDYDLSKLQFQECHLYDYKFGLGQPLSDLGLLQSGIKLHIKSLYMRFPESGSSIFNSPIHLSLKKIKVSVFGDDVAGLELFSQQLHTFLHGPAECVSRLKMTFARDALAKLIKWEDQESTVPIAPFLCGTFPPPNDESEVCVLSFKIARQSAVSPSSLKGLWSSWRLLNLRIDGCLPDKDYFQILGNRMPFLEKLDIVAVTIAQEFRWRDSIHTPVRRCPLILNFDFRED
jgi:hypothetical protein